MRILIKFGSTTLSKNNKLNYNLLKSKVKEISKLHKKGHEIIIVSSGSVACGMEIEGLKIRPTNILKLQLLSGEGQIRLIRNYKKLFDKKNMKISQILLTNHNFETRKEKQTIIKIINEYLKQGVIPIINENDLVSKEEFNSNNIFTDNDILASIIAKNLKVKLTLILTDVGGLYDCNPKFNSHPKLIREVKKINDKIKKIASNKANSLGLGGMYSKVIAAEIMTKKGIDVIVANGNLKLNDILNNKVDRTIFKKIK